MNPRVNSAIIGGGNILAGVETVVLWVSKDDLFPDGEPVAVWPGRIGSDFRSIYAEDQPVSVNDGVLFDGVDDEMYTVQFDPITSSRHVFLKIKVIDDRVSFLIGLRDLFARVYIVGGSLEGDHSVQVNAYDEGGIFVATPSEGGFVAGEFLAIHAQSRPDGLSIWTNVAGETNLAVEREHGPINSVKVGFTNSEPEYELSGHPNIIIQEAIVVLGDMNNEQIERVREYITP